MRYLGTVDAVRLAFEYARKTEQSPEALLLIGARDRPQVIVAFDEYLADPRTGIRAWDIRDRALFTLLQEGVLKPLPMFSWQLPDSADLKNLQAIAEARQKHFEELVREEAIRLIPMVTRKEDAARKVSSEAIESVVPDAAKAARLVPPDDYGLSREELIAQFPNFPPEQQSELLGKKWDLVRGPEMMPALRGILEKAPSKSLADDAMALRVWGVDEGITAPALQRLSELSPQETARILRNDIASGKLRFAGFAVRSLPAQDIPEADEVLSNLLTTNPRGSLPLVAKFATARLADQVRAHYVEPFLPCAEEVSFMSYFVRTLPEEGPGGGIELLRRAMANREERACYRQLLSQVSAVVWNSAIEKQALSTLNDTDAEAAMNAAQVLSANGGPQVEPLLWKRLKQWADRWRGRTAELEVHPITGDLPNPEGELGFRLFDAIASAQSWLLDEPRRKRLAGLCIDDECRTLWSREESLVEVQVEAYSGGTAYPTGFRVGDYRAATFEKLKGKLGQFPEGTEFRWCPQASNPFDAFSPGQRQEMFKELVGFLAERSMSIHPYLEDRCVPGLHVQPK